MQKNIKSLFLKNKIKLFNNVYKQIARFRFHVSRLTFHGSLPLCLSNLSAGQEENIRYIINSSYKGGGLSEYNSKWITGFVDGEGSFGVQCIRSPSNLSGWSVSLDFSSPSLRKGCFFLY
jgi:hypothetical protein